MAGFETLIQILIPVFDNARQHFAQATFEGVRAQLIERFGGLTAFVQSPAPSLWEDEQSGATTRDDMIWMEVMTETFDRAWWSTYRKELEHVFHQDEILIRTICGRV